MKLFFIRNRANYFHFQSLDGNIQWSIPVETNKMDEKYLALPLYGDIKMTSYSANKTVKILLEHIDFVSSNFEKKTSSFRQHHFNCV